MARSRSPKKVEFKSGWRSAWIVLAVVLALRFIHFAGALHSPLSYQLSPDENFYLRFAQAVAGGAGGSTVEFAFLDPVYGYIAGFVFRLAGENLFAVYVLQILLDTFTAFCLILIGRELKRPRAGLLAALIYGITVTALLFCTTLLKTVWVANFMTVWVLAALVLLRRPRAYGWVLFGILCGYGIALRSTLALMTLLALVLLPWLHVTWKGRSVMETLRGMGLLLLGLALPLALLTLRNHRAAGVQSPLTNNGGVVLHMHYNPDNPTGRTWIPSFVSYFHPSDIQRGYTQEAEKRLGRTLTPLEVDAYWRGQAIDYIRSNPLAAARSIAGKFAQFVAYPEIPNNRSLADERLFSPMLRILPSPFGWLFALGVPGLVLWLTRDRRAWLAFAPIATVVVTVTVFVAIDRYRFQAVPIFALGAGLFLDALAEYLGQDRIRPAALLLAAAAALGTASVLLAHPLRPLPPRLDKAVWGYIRMGDIGAAKQAGLKAAATQPNNYRLFEALAYIAAEEKDYAGAAEHYRRAIRIKPDSHVAHFRLARLLERMGRRDEAAAHAAAAVRIARRPEYEALLRELTAGK